MTLKERITHWPSNLEGLAWSATASYILNTLCPTLSSTDPTQLLAMIPVIRGLLAGGQISPKAAT